jgi:hypothetical protein
MMDEQDFALAHDEDRHGEINFFVNVRHKTGGVCRSHAPASMGTDVGGYVFG